MNQKLMFVALLPPESVQQAANLVKQDFADNYRSRAALKSPPHITLQPPFRWQLEDLAQLRIVLRQFAQKQRPIPIILDGYGAFKPRVIYINVIRSPELLEIHQQLMADLESNLNIVHPPSKTRPFAPHMTVGFRDLTKANFWRAWEQYEHKSFYFEFRVFELTLLIHDGKVWQIEQQFSLAKTRI